MMDKLGILLMEEENGSTSVQLFADPDKAVGSYDNLIGKEGQKPQRAVFVHITHGDKPSVMMKTKMLPVPQIPKSEMPDAWILGKGPIFLDSDKSHPIQG